ncbi:helix-turn-helix domain-containing protein [Sphingomonas sp. CFBP 8760]|uniref:helix-turn-helix domain-containing protein n=1 Tax=Sphingomonas sp. CFBP 8760 TaxID=2775282 RepID=UPI0017838089|nr:helix-turn-helix domain-containing protein [Sphingomonas sp. CFBP 8760]
MTALAIGTAAATILARIGSGHRRPTRSGATNRTGAPVRRDSLEAGTFEDLFFVLPAKGETDRMLTAARKILDEGRKLQRKARATGEKLSVSERAVAALTAGAVRVYEEICTIARLCAGRVFPSYDHLADATGLSRNTVARAIPVLGRLGLLVKQRRFKRVEVEGDQDAGKPRYRQFSNAYRPMLPKSLIRYLPRCMRPAPPPADAVQREADRQEDQQRMLSQLSCRELARATMSGPMGAALASLGARLDADDAASAAGKTASAITVLNR